MNTPTPTSRIASLFALLLAMCLSNPLAARELLADVTGTSPNLPGTAVQLRSGFAKSGTNTNVEVAARLANSRADYSDGWWVPGESGWGMNVLQQGDVLALTFFVYDENSTPIWYLGVAHYIDENIGYRGTLSQHRGTSFLLPTFGPVQFGPTPIGVITFKPESAYAANVNYTVGTTSIDKSMVRIAFADIDLSGAFWGGSAGTATGCGAVVGTVTAEQFVIATATVTNGQGQLLIANTNGHCVISGVLQQHGLMTALTNGLYACTNGASGVASIDEWTVNRNGMTARIRARSGDCIEESRFAGARRL